MQGVSTRKAGELVKALEMGDISKSQISKLCEEPGAEGFSPFFSQ